MSFGAVSLGQSSGGNRLSEVHSVRALTPENLGAGHSCNLCTPHALMLCQALLFGQSSGRNRRVSESDICMVARVGQEAMKLDGIQRYNEVGQSSDRNSVAGQRAMARPARGWGRLPFAADHGLGCEAAALIGNPDRPGQCVLGQSSGRNRLSVKEQNQNTNCQSKCLIRRPIWAARQKRSTVVAFPSGALTLRPA